MTHRLSIILSLKNKYDYAEFVAACRAANIAQLEWPEYAAKVTTLEYAIDMFPELQPFDAYMKQLENNGWMLGVPLQQIPCSSCGGGKTR